MLSIVHSLASGLEFTISAAWRTYVALMHCADKSEEKLSSEYGMGENGVECKTKDYYLTSLALHVQYIHGIIWMHRAREGYRPGWVKERIGEGGKVRV